MHLIGYTLTVLSYTLKLRTKTMVDKRRATLDARVKATNMINAWANKVGPILLERFRPLVGVKLLKVDGSFLEKYKHLCEIPLPDKMHRYHRDNSGYWLSFNLDVCVSVEGYEGCIYEKNHVHIGNFDGQTLKDVRNAPLASETLRTNYTAEEVIALRAEFDRCKKIAQQAESALYPFGEYDRF